MGPLLGPPVHGNFHMSHGVHLELGLMSASLSSWGSDMRAYTVVTVAHVELLIGIQPVWGFRTKGFFNLVPT